MSGTSRSPVAPPRNRRNRWIRVVAAAVVFVSLTTTGPMALAQFKTPDEIRKEIEADKERQRQAKEDAAENLGEIDVLTQNIGELVSAFETLEAARDSAQEAVDAAIRKLEEALAEQARTEARIAELEDEVAETELLLQQSAVNAFTSFQGPNSEQTALSSDPWQHARNQALRSFANRSTEDILDAFRGQAAELEALREESDRYVNELEQLRNDALEREDNFNRAAAREDAALKRINQRLDHRLSEAAAIEHLDAQLAAEIRSGEQQLATAIARAEALRRAQTITRPPNADFDLTTVQGITVNVLIAEELDGFLDAMAAEGFDLFGSGYRTNSRQIELRMAHCGTSDYAVYQMPSSQCSPPTARPGFSMHEVGLAVDFIHNGRLIRSRNTAVFQAMARIAPGYGLLNLPSEPWHWSTTGQ